MEQVYNSNFKHLIVCVLWMTHWELQVPSLFLCFAIRNQCSVPERKISCLTRDRPFRIFPHMNRLKLESSLRKDQPLQPDLPFITGKAPAFQEKSHCQCHSNRRRQSVMCSSYTGNVKCIVICPVWPEGGCILEKSPLRRVC